ncbi:MAG: hypothetical protein O7E51_11960 [Acidobacteria bacterium]|nr:hypothetical protein [Acidobacteriota bacterium]
MKISKWILAMVLACSLPGMVFADILVLKDGRSVTGEFQSADQTNVTILVQGRLQNYRLSEVNSITFTPGSREASRSSRAPSYAAGRSPSSSSGISSGGTSSGGTFSQRAAPEPTPTGVTIPAGVLLTVRMIDPVDSEVNAMGQTFRASLDEPLLVAGQIVVPRGADLTVILVEVEQAGRIRGRSELTLDLLDITVGGKKHEIRTSEVSQAGSSRGAQSAKRIGGIAAAGAVLGAIFGGGKGAVQGAAAGAGAGTAIQVLTHGEEVRIPAESRLSFTLESPIHL